MGGKRKPPLVMKSRRWRRTSIDPARPDLGERYITFGKFDPTTMDYVAEFEGWRKNKMFPSGLKKYLMAKAGDPKPMGLMFALERTGVVGTFRTWTFQIEKGHLVGKAQRWRFPRLGDIPPNEVANPTLCPMGALRLTEQNIETFERGIAIFKKIWTEKTWDKFSNVTVATTHSSSNGLTNARRIDFVIEEKLPGNFIFRVTNRYLDRAALLMGNTEFSYGPTVSWHFSRCEEYIPRWEAFLAKFRELQVPFNEKRDALKNPEFKLLLGTPEEEEKFYAKRNLVSDNITGRANETNIP